jgi:hypothetical protein
MHYSSFTITVLHSAMPEPLRPEQSATPTSKRRRKPNLAERVGAHCAESAPAHFSTESMLTMACAIEAIAPGRDPLELALFMDWATGRLLGRMRRRAGMPGEHDLFNRGLTGIDQFSRQRYNRPFASLALPRRKALLESIEDGKATGGVWCEIPPQYWYRRFYTKLLHGMFAERKEWLRIGVLRTTDPGEDAGSLDASADA